MSLRELILYFRKVSGNVTNVNFGPLVDAVQNLMVADAVEIFSRRESPSGAPWAPLKSRSGSPLILTGALYSGVIRSYQSPMKIPNGLRFEYLGPEYGVYHQFGTPTIPQREFWGISNDLIDKLKTLAVNEAANLVVK